MVALDTNVLLYACDRADPKRQQIAIDLIANSRDGVLLWKVPRKFDGGLICCSITRTLTPYNREELMDAESLVQIERIVTAAVSGAEGRVRQELGEKTEALAGSLRQEFRQEAETLAASLQQGFRQELGEKTEALATSLRQEFREGIEEVKGHSGVLYEDVLHRIDLVVEGHQGLREGLQALREQVRDLDAKIEHESLETRALIQLSYRQLQERVETLEQRVQIIEKRLGLSA